MKIGVPKETAAHELRVALIPDVVASLTAKGSTSSSSPGPARARATPTPSTPRRGAEIGDPWGADVVAHVAVPTRR